MKIQWLKVPAGYFLFTLIYYPIAYLVRYLDLKAQSSTNHNFASALDSIFYWAHTHVVYILTLIGSSLIGSLWYYRKSKPQITKGFILVFLLSTMYLIIVMLVGI